METMDLKIATTLNDVAENLCIDNGWDRNRLRESQKNTILLEGVVKYLADREIFEQENQPIEQIDLF